MNDIIRTVDVTITLRDKKVTKSVSVEKGKLIIFIYDHTNQQSDYKNLWNLNELMVKII